MPFRCLFYHAWICLKSNSFLGRNHCINQCKKNSIVDFLRCFPFKKKRNESSQIPILSILHYHSKLYIETIVKQRIAEWFETLCGLLKEKELGPHIVVVHALYEYLNQITSQTTLVGIFDVCCIMQISIFYNLYFYKYITIHSFHSTLLIKMMSLFCRNYFYNMKRMYNI